MSLLLLALSLPPAAMADPKDAANEKAHDLQIRLYSSLFTGIREGDAKAATWPLVRRLADQVNYPIKTGLVKGSSREHLMDFGQKLCDGTYHLGAVWGLEYGWLTMKYPELKALAVCVAGKDTGVPLRYQLLVRSTDRVTDLKSLKGKRLARFEGETLMVQVVLSSMLQKEFKKDTPHPNDFFRSNKPTATIRTAIFQVLDDEADCILVDAVVYFKLQQAWPTLLLDLATLRQSEEYPEAVLIGSPKQLRKLRPALWDQLQENFLTIHDTFEGRAMVKFWGIDSFMLPDERYLKRVERSIRSFPISSLAPR